VQLLIQQSAAEEGGAWIRGQVPSGCSASVVPSNGWAGLAAGYVDLGQGYDGVMQQIIWQGSKGLI
jgi:hypothetical protein